MMGYKLGSRVLSSLAFAAVLAAPAGAFAQAKGVSDAQVEANVLKAFAGDQRLANQPINTSTVFGTVTLTGSVSDEGARDAAEQIASRTDGVKKVVDQLSVGAPAQTAAAQTGQGYDPAAQNTMPGAAMPASQGAQIVGQGDPQNGNVAPNGQYGQAQGYPQQQQSYPQPQQGYPQPQQGYPQGQYPPQKGQPAYGDPQAQGNYPPPQGNYPPAATVAVFTIATTSVSRRSRVARGRLRLRRVSLAGNESSCLTIPCSQSASIDGFRAVTLTSALASRRSLPRTWSPGDKLRSRAVRRSTVRWSTPRAPAR